MCEVMEKYEQKAAERAAKEAAIKANVESIKFMITTLNVSKEQLLQQYSEYEYREALNELSKKLKRTISNRGGSFLCELLHITHILLYYFHQSHCNKNSTRVSAIALLR